MPSESSKQAWAVMEGQEEKGGVCLLMGRA